MKIWLIQAIWKHHVDDLGDSNTHVLAALKHNPSEEEVKNNFERFLIQFGDGDASPHGYRTHVEQVILEE